MFTRTLPRSRPLLHDQRWPGWHVVVGIETHAQIKSSRKLFSETLTARLHDEPNTHVSPFDAAFPGTLPKVNPTCVDLGLRTALALNCTISPRSSFDRKHYFYSDLPSGYQITQQYSPLAKNGLLQVQVPNAEPITVRIKQIQLEQDTAKSTLNARTQTSHIDLNRAGTGLMEIVSEPDLRSPEEAGAYVRTLQAVLRALGSSDGNMEEGSLRCDVNVSINKPGEPPGTRCEIKNLNSVKFMMAAITHEIHRQRSFLLSNPSLSVPQETRGFNEDTFETFRLRSKEDAPDYRYMPDPNLGDLVISQSRIDEIKRTLPALPWERRKRLLERYPEIQKEGKERNLDVLLALDGKKDVGYDGERVAGALEYFEELCDPSPSATTPKKRSPILALNYLTHHLIGTLSLRKENFSQNTLTPAQLGALLDLVSDKRVTGTSAKILLRHLLEHPLGTEGGAEEVEVVAKKLGLININDSASAAGSQSSSTSSSDPSSPSPSRSSELHTWCQAAIIAMPSQAEALRTGKSKGVLNKLVGHVMKASRGRADALEVRRVLEEMVGGPGAEK